MGHDDHPALRTMWQIALPGSKHDETKENTSIDSRGRCEGEPLRNSSSIRNIPRIRFDTFSVSLTALDVIIKSHYDHNVGNLPFNANQATIHSDHKVANRPFNAK